MGKFTTLFATLIAAGLFTPVWAQIDLNKQQDFLDIVEPLITKGELEIYNSLADYDSRKYFKAIFWYKRDPQPDTASNTFRDAYLVRMQSAGDRFAEGKIPGAKTDRGKVFLLLGEPDDVVQNQLPNSGLRPGYEEIWEYKTHELKLRFVFDGIRPIYRLEGSAKLEPVFENIRNGLVLDRAEPFQLGPLPLTLPNLGFTKDIENLAAEDRHEMDYRVSYSFFRGDLNKTEILVGLTFLDASDRGVDIHLAAYDPFEHKEKEIKKLILPENGRYVSFTMPVEFDQYNLVLRLTDKDGRQDISRTYLDVPRIGGLETSASSLLLAEGMEPIPLYGFDRPKMFAFGSRFFPVQNYFPHFNGERLYLMQEFYNFDQKPSLTYFLDHREVESRVEQLIEEDGVIRVVASIPVAGINPGTHHIKSVYPDESGNMVVTSVQWQIGNNGSADGLLERSETTDRFEIIHPAEDAIESFDRVVLRTANGLDIRRMYVFLNENLILERHRSPWEVTVDDGMYSVSGQNTLTVVLDTGDGLLKAEKVLTPLRVGENIQSRVVQIYFNAFTQDLNFVHDLDLETLSVKVDEQAYEPREVSKVDEPITYCFAVDTSYSMKDSFNSNISALKKFIESMRPMDRGYFVAFNSDYTQFLEPTASKSVLLAVADNLKLQRPNPKQSDRIYEENQTYLYDAMISSIHTLLQYSGRTIVVLVSDGVGKEAIYSKAGMLAYAREHATVIYSLWLDNNPTLSEDERAFLQKERSGGEKFARKIGLSRFFAKKDAKATHIGNKVRQSSINEGMVKILAEESGGFHYRIFRADRTLIREYVTDIEEAIASQYVMSLSLPISVKDHEVKIVSSDPNIRIRSKSKVKVRKSNPLID